MKDYLDNLGRDSSKLRKSNLLDSVIGYDYVLPKGVSHNLLNVYANENHKHRHTFDEKGFNTVCRVIEELNPIIMQYGGITNSHDLHGIASNMHIEDIWGKGKSERKSNSWLAKYVKFIYEKMKDV